MCGIIGYTGAREAIGVLLEGLEVLAYRGYDSAGVAVTEGDRLRLCRAEGKLERLKERVNTEAAFTGHCGIGHTRWATHGAPTERNAHPHRDAGGLVAVVHNGILENEAALRRELEGDGVVFTSETDTEVIPHLLARYLRECGEPIAAIRATIARLRGAYALGMVFRDHPREIYAVRCRSPLALARGEDGCYLASDVTALLPYSRAVAYPEEGELVRITPEGITLYPAEGTAHAPLLIRVSWEREAAGKAGYRHYMEKELCEVPHAVEDTLSAVRRPDAFAGDVLAGSEEVLLLGCGSAYHVGLLAAVTGEALTGVRMHAQIASEARYRRSVLLPNALILAISQSGETADTLAALREQHACGNRTAAIVNVPSSAIAREAEQVFYTQAGPEIAVATTKAYCAQVVATWGMLAALRQARGDTAGGEQMLDEMRILSACCREILASRGDIARLALPLVAAHDSFFIGRGADAAVCREGALKLKEITYLHAEAFDAGELKHGTISLIERGTPVVAVLTQPRLVAQMHANIREVMARGAHVMAILGDGIEAPAGCDTYRLPACAAWAAPLLAAYVMQWMAYEVCIRRGGEPDMPRNLAKSVTVE